MFTIMDGTLAVGLTTEPATGDRVWGVRTPGRYDEYRIVAVDTTARCAWGYRTGAYRVPEGD